MFSQNTFPALLTELANGIQPSEDSGPRSAHLRARQRQSVFLHKHLLSSRQKLFFLPPLAFLFFSVVITEPKARHIFINTVLEDKLMSPVGKQACLHGQRVRRAPTQPTLGRGTTPAGDSGASPDTQGGWKAPATPGRSGQLLTGSANHPVPSRSSSTS